MAMPTLRITNVFNDSAKATAFNDFLDTLLAGYSAHQDGAISTSMYEANGEYHVFASANLTVQRDILYIKDACVAELSDPAYTGFVVSQTYKKHMCESGVACSEVDA